MELLGDLIANNERDKVKECLSEILGIDAKIKELKESRADWVDELESVDPGFKYVTPENSYYFSQEIQVTIKNTDVFDYLSIPENIRHYFSKNCFLKGVLKAEDGAKEMVFELPTGKLKFTKGEPKI